jgi:proline iminopeptidase
LFYHIAGQGGDTVVVVHGFQGNDEQYLTPDLGPLVRGRTVVFYEQRGEGRSEWVRDPRHLGIEDHVRDLEALRRYLGIDRLRLLGHSGGGLIATRYALEHPTTVERLLLVAAPVPTGRRYEPSAASVFYARLDSATWKRVNELQASLPTAADPVAVCREIVRTTVPVTFFANRAAFARMRGDFCAAPPDRLRTQAERLGAFQQSLSSLSWTQGLRSLRIPALIIHGDHDAIPLASARDLADLIPGARLLVIHDADHLPWVEKPAEFFRAADQFFRGEWPAGATAVSR